MSHQLGGSSSYANECVRLCRLYNASINFVCRKSVMLLIRLYEQIKINNWICTYWCYRNLHLSIALSTGYHHDHKVNYFWFMLEFMWNIGNNFNNLLHLLLLDSWLSATNGFISFLFNAFSLIYLRHVAKVKFSLIMQ